MKIIGLVILIILARISFGQTDKQVTIRQTGSSIEEFVPIGWRILKRATGDLNKDSLDDAAVVIQKIDPSQIKIVPSEEMGYDTIDSNLRVLFIIIKNSLTNGYLLSGRTNTFIVRHYPEESNDTFKSIQISKGVLKIRYLFKYSNWMETELLYVFRYQKNHFTLIGADYDEFDRGSFKSIKRSFNFSTKKMSETTATYLETNDKGEPLDKRTEWKDIKIEELKTIETITRPLDWRLLPDVEI